MLKDADIKKKSASHATGKVTRQIYAALNRQGITRHMETIQRDSGGRECEE